MSTTLPEQSRVQNLATDYGLAAAATLVFYDYILTVRHEQQLIWTGGFSFVICLFFLIRYTGFLFLILFAIDQLGSLISASSCSGIMYMLSVSGIVTLHSSTLVLAIRTWAIWQRNALCGIFIGIAWLSNTVLATVFQLYGTVALIPDEHSAGGAAVRRGCGMPMDTASTASNAYKEFVCLVSYEAFIFVLTAIRGRFSPQPAYSHWQQPTPSSTAYTARTATCPTSCTWQSASSRPRGSSLTFAVRRGRTMTIGVLLRPVRRRRLSMMRARGKTRGVACSLGDYNPLRFCCSQ